MYSSALATLTVALQASNLGRSALRKGTRIAIDMLTAGLLKDLVRPQATIHFVIYLCQLALLSGCDIKAGLNECARVMQDMYQTEQRKPLADTRRKDLKHIDWFYMATNGETQEKARLYFRTGGSRSPRVWVVEHTCPSDGRSQKYTKAMKPVVQIGEN
jgi:hypothetical protein